MSLKISSRVLSIREDVVSAGEETVSGVRGVTDETEGGIGKCNSRMFLTPCFGSDNARFLCR